MRSENQFPHKKMIPGNVVLLVGVLLLFLLILIFIWLWYDIQMKRLNNKETQYKTISLHRASPSLNPKPDQTL